ncbi:hypothetical protein OAR16_00305 [bacterium]|nr:hypothetical protein [bacterium]
MAVAVLQRRRLRGGPWDQWRTGGGAIAVTGDKFLHAEGFGEVGAACFGAALDAQGEVEIVVVGAEDGAADQLVVGAMR